MTPAASPRAVVSRPVVGAVVAALTAVACTGAPAAGPVAAPDTPVATPSPTSADEPPSAPTPTPALATPPPQPGPPAERVGNAEPRELAVELAASERAIRDPATPGAELERWAWAQQLGYRDLVVHPAWQAPVRAAVPADLRPDFDANLRAATALRALTRPRTELPEWRIVPPPARDTLLGHYRGAAADFGVGWEYLAAIHLVETRVGRIRGTSVAGARGPMQFLPSTWAAYGDGDIDDPGDAIRAAARYLVAHGAPRNMCPALYAYNHSDLYVEAIEAYASVLRREPHTYRGFYHWRVTYRTTVGDVVLPEGWSRAASWAGTIRLD